MVLGPGVAVGNLILSKLLMEVLDVPLVIKLLVELKYSCTMSMRHTLRAGFSGSFIQKTLEALLFDDRFPTPDGSRIHSQDLGCFIPGDTVVFCSLKDFLYLHEMSALNRMGILGFIVVKETNYGALVPPIRLGADHEDTRSLSKSRTRQYHL